MGLLDGLFGGGGNDNDQTVTNKTQIPKWQEDFYRDYTSKIADQLDLAGNIYNQQRNYTPYGGSRIQGFTPDEMKAYEGIRANQGAAMGDLGASRSALNSAMGQYDGPNYTGGNMGTVTTQGYGGPRYVGGNMGRVETQNYDGPRFNARGVDQAKAGTFTGRTVNSYLDPYKSAVLDQTVKRLGRERDRSLLGDRAFATKNGALGSAGLALREAETERGYADAVGNASAQILDQGYGRAADIYAGDQSRALQATGINLQGIQGERSGFDQDQARALQAAGINLNAIQGERSGFGQDQGQALQAAGLNLQGIGQQQGMFNTGAARNLQAGQALGTLAQQNQSLRMNDTNALLAAGQQQRQLGQQGLDLAYGDFQRQQDYPWQQFNNLSAATRGVQFAPSGGGTSTQSTSVGNPSPLAQAAGAGLAAYGLGTQFGLFSQGGPVKTPKRKQIKFGGMR